MPLIALTGGIAAGKSTVARRLAERGAVVVDADALVREAQQPGSAVLDRISEEFGAEVIRSDGSLDRGALGAIVFGDDAAIARLNAIVHPAVRDLSQARFAAARAASPDAVIVYDVPLLVEARGNKGWDLVVVAHAPAPLRTLRLQEERGMSAAEAESRIASQVSDEARLAVADVVIDTSGSMEQTIAQTDALWDRLTAPSVGGPA